MSSVVENMANNQEALTKEVQRVQGLMAKTPTGRKMLETSQSMASSEQMISLMALIGDPSVTEQERVLLAQYMGEMLKRDPKDGLVQYAVYLEGVAADPRYAVRSEYYKSIAVAARNLHVTDVYQIYIGAYTEFEADNTPDAVAARKATEEMQAKMKKWAEGLPA